MLLAYVIHMSRCTRWQYLLLITFFVLPIALILDIKSATTQNQVKITDDDDDDAG